MPLNEEGESPDVNQRTVVLHYMRPPPTLAEITAQKGTTDQNAVLHEAPYFSTAADAQERKVFAGRAFHIPLYSAACIQAIPEWSSKFTIKLNGNKSSSQDHMRRLTPVKPPPSAQVVLKSLDGSTDANKRNKITDINAGSKLAKHVKPTSQVCPFSVILTLSDRFWKPKWDS